MALEKIDSDSLDPAATIVVATGNAHKLTEIEAILGKVMPEVRFVALGHHQGADCRRGDGPYGHCRRFGPGRRRTGR